MKHIGRVKGLVCASLGCWATLGLCISESPGLGHFFSEGFCICSLAWPFILIFLSTLDMVERVSLTSDTPVCPACVLLSVVSVIMLMITLL